MAGCSCKRAADCDFAIVRQAGGRSFELCSGVNCSDEQRESYRAKFAELEDSVDTFDEIKGNGLGDRIARGIKAVTRGKAKPCSGCNRRRARLNSWFPGKVEPARQVSLQNCTRHLTYHVWPVADASKSFGMLRWNIEQLKQRWGLFNGRKLISIATDSSTMSFDDCVAEFGDVPGAEFLQFRNSKKLREVVSWLPMLERLDPDNMPSDHVIFSAHAKGCRYGRGGTIEPWAGMMYEGLLDRWEERVKHPLESFGAVGLFKRFGQFSGFRHHYSGTFFWHRDLKHRNWRFVPRKWWGVEAWIGHQYRREHTACIFGEHVDDLYRQDVNDETLRRFKEWNATVTS